VTGAAGTSEIPEPICKGTPGRSSRRSPGRQGSRRPVRGRARPGRQPLNDYFRNMPKSFRGPRPPSQSQGARAS
jgi:hypothetical protein